MTQKYLKCEKTFENDSLVLIKHLKRQRVKLMHPNIEQKIK